MNVLYTWIGKSDLRAVHGNERKGPVADALLNLQETLDRAVLLFDCVVGTEEEKEGPHYVNWLEQQLRRVGKPVNPILKPIAKGDPTSFVWVYDAMRRAVSESESVPDIQTRHYLVGPGTSTMAACTLIMSRLAACAGKLWQVDEKSPQGYRALELPFDLYLQDAPDPASHAPERAPGAQRSTDTLICYSPSTCRAVQLAQRAAKSKWPVLILGSTGTGKEKIAEQIREHMQRHTQKMNFVALNCGAIPENLIDAELFGHKKGAFTGALADRPGVFEQASDGVVFLDEVGELPLNAQTRFLRVLQEGKVTRLGEHTERDLRCRIVAATHRNLWQAVKEGRFRADLYYRLAGLIITLDELNDRPEDLQKMIDYFWQGTVAENPGFPGRDLSEEARHRLLTHTWPGNVRELKTTLVRTAFLAEAPRVTAADVELALAKPGEKTQTTGQHGLNSGALPAENTSGIANPDLNLKANLNRYRRELIQQALKQAGGNKSQAARILDITPQHLARLLKD